VLEDWSLMSAKLVAMYKNVIRWEMLKSSIFVDHQLHARGG